MKVDKIFRIFVLKFTTMEKKITKKAFKERCDLHRYGKWKVLYYDWADNYKTAKDNKYWAGFKYGVKENSRRPLKTKELYDIAYDWIVNGIEVPYYVNTMYAETDEKRFKVPISLSF